MKLVKVKLKNFRGYKNFEVRFDSDFNVVIGRNDIGKSTILEALEIFFNSDEIKLDISDLCVYARSFDWQKGKELWTACYVSGGGCP